MRVRILDEAERDLEEGYHFYERQSPGLGTYFLDALYSDIDSLSYFGGIHQNESLHFIEMVRKGKCVLLISEIVVAELDKAPAAVQNILLLLPEKAVEKVEITNEILELRNEYIKAKILGHEWINDATHVAAATVSRADAIVSWNFKHIVRLDKMKAYNQVNLMNGYGILTIISPKEVLIDED